MVTGSNPITIASLTDDGAGEAHPDTSITWSAATSGGTAPLEYQFWRYNYGLSTWTMVRDYNQDATYSWVPTTDDLGQYAIHVRVRSAGKLAFEAYRETSVIVY
jgi:hypothetical protein